MLQAQNHLPKQAIVGAEPNNLLEMKMQVAALRAAILNNRMRADTRGAARTRRKRVDR
jgi:hypothetical protein